MILKGFSFGMVLQLAVGPVCIYIFQAAITGGFYSAEAGVAGVALTDGIFILAAILGIAKIIEKENVKRTLKISGSVVLLIFGIRLLMGSFAVGNTPNINSGDIDAGRPFVKAMLLTASNPLTMVFWAGVFAARLSGDGMKRKDVYLYGFGALLSTLVFLTFIAGLGSLTKNFISAAAMQVLNLGVGALLIYFSVKMVLKSKN